MGHVEIVGLLLEAGAEKNQSRTDTGEAPLWVAAGQGNLEIARLLLKAGAGKNQAKRKTGDHSRILSQNGAAPAWSLASFSWARPRLAAWRNSCQLSLVCCVGVPGDSQKLPPHQLG